MIAARITHILPGVLVGAVVFLTCVLVVSGWCTIIAQAQLPNVREVKTDFVPESGCPVSISSAKTEFEIDPFGAPLASRIYVTYRNDSAKAVSGVKFRIRFADAGGAERGTFQAAHAAVVGPGSTGTEKWRHEKVDPRASQIKIRVLMVKFTDGDLWQSSKLPDQAGSPQPPQ
jgi:hypothetical protein